MEDIMQTLKEFKSELETAIQEAETIFVTPHIGADFDAIASSIGIYLIAKKLNKPCYIIMDEEPHEIEPGVKRIIDECRDKISFISLNKYTQLRGTNDLLVTVDVNKTYMVCCKEYLSDFANTVILDHHEEDSNTISTGLKYIRPEVSSTCEMLVDLLCQFGIRYDKNIANYLLAGIYLDTNKLKKNTTCGTIKAVGKLMEKGASISYVNDFFKEDFVSDRKVQALVSRANFINFTIAIAIAEDIESYSKEELAKAADYLLKFQADASFALGHTDENEISISARSEGKVDVGAVMKILGGGGHIYSAGGKLENETLEEAGKHLQKILLPNHYIVEG